jgi:hypothetical protein
MICKAPISVLNLPYANILGYLKYLNMTFGEKISMLRKQLKWSQDGVESMSAMRPCHL